MSEKELVRRIVWGETRIARLSLILTFTLASLTAHASESPKSVFVKAICNGKLSASVLSSFREGIRTSQKYQLIPALDDNGRMDVVAEVEMSCTERDKVVAIATAYALAKCVGPGNCHAVMDGSSLTVSLCDSDSVADCGRALFKVFDGYMSRPNTPQLKSQ
jgi:hypothetical protein